MAKSGVYNSILMLHPWFWPATTLTLILGVCHIPNIGVIRLAVLLLFLTTSIALVVLGITLMSKIFFLKMFKINNSGLKELLWCLKTFFLKTFKIKNSGLKELQGLQTLSVKSHFDVRGRKIGQISKVEVFS